MRQICRGWRRKIGLVTLIMAAISMAGWLRSRIIPYWSIVIPLTLLSAYLILWVPRIPITPTRSVDNSVSA